MHLVDLQWDSCTLHFAETNKDNFSPTLLSVAVMFRSNILASFVQFKKFKLSINMINRQRL